MSTTDFWSSLFDPWRQAASAWDVLGASGTSAQQIAVLRARRLRRLLDVAVAHSPLYHDRLTPAPGHATSAAQLLGSMAPLTRHELMQDFDRWCCDRRIRRSVVEQHLADPLRIAEPLLGEYLVWESSGTQGEPGFFIQDAQAMAIYDSLESLRRSGSQWFDPLMLGERIAFVGATDGHFASYVSVERLRRLNPWLGRAIRSISIMQPLDALIAALDEFEPTVIATYPTAATLLAQAFRAGKMQVRPREIWTGGESINDAERTHIESSFECTLRNNYGASEFLTLGSDCAQGHLHLNADWAILEPVDERGQPVPAGSESATTLLTNLANHVQPLIRYDIGDQVVISPDPCACGSPFPVIQVQGRRDDALVMAGIHGDDVTVLPLALMTALEEDAGVFDFQLQQRDRRSLCIRLAHHDTHGGAVMARCREALGRFALAQGLAAIELIWEPGHSIERGRSGKIKRIIAPA